MNEEQIRELLEEIAPDKDGVGYIDCSSGSGYTDDNQYERIIAAVKQNVELQNINKELTKKLADADAQVMSLSNDKNILRTINENSSKEIEVFMNELCIFLDDIKQIKYPLRIADYLFEKLNKHVVYSYDPLQQAEPIEVKILLTENTNKNNICPICDKKIGKYPVISRKDNKTEICSNCGMVEALEIYNNQIKEENNE